VTTSALKAPKHPLLANGKRIHLRRSQMLLWGVIAGAVFAAFMAGLYCTVTQLSYFGDSLKPAWDGLFKTPWWAVYRRTSFRDIPEPAFAVIGYMTLMVKPKYWDKTVSTTRLVITPFILIISVFALGIGATWLLNYGLPVHVRNVLAWHYVGDLLAGLIIAHLMRFLFAPVGAVIQQHLMESGADRAAARQRVPLWVRLPDAPPVVRERFSHMYSKARKVTGDLFEKNRSKTWVIGFMVLFFVVVSVIGFISHYYFGAGHTELGFLHVGN
jgi:hypothetical protein